MDSMETRRNAIVDLINENGTVSFSQLKDAFPNVSEMTLRTDLKLLDEARRILRIHGGAKSVQVLIGTDDFLGRKSVRNFSLFSAETENSGKSIDASASGHHRLPGFRQYHDNVCPSVSRSVQLDLHHGIKLRHGACQSDQACRNDSGGKAEPLQPERIWIFRYQGAGRREFSPAASGTRQY